MLLSMRKTMPPKISKAEFVSMVAEKLDLTQNGSNKTIQVIFEEIAKLLKQGSSITLPSFGTLSIKERPERTGRNPFSGEAINIAARKAAVFKAGKELKAFVNS